MAQSDDGLFDYNSETVLKEKTEHRKKHKLNDDYPQMGGIFALLADNRKGYPKIHCINTWEEIDHSINKVSVAYHKDTMAEVSAQIKRDLQEHYWLGLTTPRWLELVPPGITKGSSLTALVEMLDIPMYDMTVFGDGENDIEMLQAAGIDIVMGNVMAKVKTAADEVTGGNNDEGIADALQEYFAI